MCLNQRSRDRLTIEQKYRIIMHNMHFPNLTQMQLGQWAQKEFNLHHSVKQKTVSNVLNSQDKVIKAYEGGNLKGKSSRALTMPQLDNDILEYIQAMNAKSLPVNRGTIAAFAKVVAHRKYCMHELPKNKQIHFSDGWLTDVFKRIGVKSRHLYGEKSSVDLTSSKIVEELRKIEELLEPYDPKDILNFDETGLYYEQQPTRTICQEPLGGSKKSKNRFTVGLITNYDGSYKGHPIVIGKRKTPKAANKKPALYRRTTNIGQSHYVEYHSSPNAWMNTDIFRKYVKRLNVSFVYAGRKVALLVDNASVHKLKEEFSNIKLIFLPANTTSKLQPLDAGIIANFKAQFRWHQYYRAVNKYLAGVSLDLTEEYRMDEVDALYFLADSWIKVKPQTIQNCWDHTKILDFKFAQRQRVDSEDVLPSFELPLDDDLVSQLNEIIPELPGNRSNDGVQLVTEVNDLDLNADESDAIVFNPVIVEFEDGDDVTHRSQELEVEEEPVEIYDVDTKEIREKLKHAYETILYHTIPMDKKEKSMLKTIRRNLNDIRSEEVAEKNQTDLRDYFV
ncbi:Translocation protein S62 [Mucor velutinosus]|uniref:Translocation protein S62 n=1 Tax=Mucor velutinosus TaxID=708070 RepID=A0AAN7HXQ2_9FUNG|nr:Translocation protein S62 [Mucor velutinosus]